jgi:flagellar biosynthesis/type III secretory pathway M-ring protein FliF/YscJ
MTITAVQNLLLEHLGEYGERILLILAGSLVIAVALLVFGLGWGQAKKIGR